MERYIEKLLEKQAEHFKVYYKNLNNHYVELDKDKGDFTEGHKYDLSCTKKNNEC